MPARGHALGRPRERLDVLEGFGEALGLAFQLSDDIMDFTASQATLGKEPGQDLREGVYTLPVLHALEGPDGQALRELLEPGPPSGERLERALAIVRAPANLAHARRAVVAEVERAQGLADTLPQGAGTHGVRAARGVPRRAMRSQEGLRQILLGSALLGKTFTSVGEALA